jgi:hypothetical protein
MKLLPPNLEAALELAESDPNQAAEVLRIAATYLKNQEKMPYALAYYLGDAFERAMKRASTARGSELLINLNLMVTHRRKSANFEHVGSDLERLLQSSEPKGDAILLISEKYGISDSTVKRLYKKYQEYQAFERASDALLDQELQIDYDPQSKKKPKLKK